MTVPEYASRPVAPTRPGTVTAGIVIVLVGVVLGFILLLVLGTVVPPAEVIDTARFGMLISLGVVVVNAIALIVIARGHGWGRFLLILTGVVGVGSALILSSGVSFGDALYVLAIVLLFLPKSNEYFAARSAVRAAR